MLKNLKSTDGIERRATCHERVQIQRLDREALGLCHCRGLGIELKAPDDLMRLAGLEVL